MTDTLFFAFDDDWNPIELKAKGGWLSDLDPRIETALKTHFAKLGVDPYCPSQSEE
jgi:hypothetical protein